MGRRGLNWPGSGHGHVAGTCECGNEPSGSINAANFLTGWGEGLCSGDYLRDVKDGDSDYVALEYSMRVNTEFQRCGRKVLLPIRNYYLGVCQEAMGKSRRELIRCGPCCGWSPEHALAVSVLSTGHIYLRFLLQCSEQRLLLPSVLSFFLSFFLSRLDGPGFKFRQGREIFFPPKPSRLATGPSQPPVQRVPGFCLGVKRLGREVDNSPSGAEDRNGWSYTSASPIYTATTVPCTFIFRIYVLLLFVTVKHKAQMWRLYRHDSVSWIWMWHVFHARCNGCTAMTRSC